MLSVLSQNHLLPLDLVSHLLIILRFSIQTLGSQGSEGHCIMLLKDCLNVTLPSNICKDVRSSYLLTCQRDPLCKAKLTHRVQPRHDLAGQNDRRQGQDHMAALNLNIRKHFYSPCFP